MRTQHKIKRNHKSEVPQHLVFVDTETKGTQINDKLQHHYLWFGYALGIRRRKDRGKITLTKRWYRFVTAQDFWYWVVDNSLPRTRTWVFAHNWNFDAGILSTSSNLPELGFVLTRYINDKPPFILEYRNCDRTIRLVDTLNYFAGSLADIGESIGVAKLDFPSGDQTQEVWNTYCKRDVEVTAQAVLNFINLVEDLDLGTFQSTLASQSMTAYRHRFMPVDIYIHDRERICKLEREGYYGGRTECFYLGDIRRKVYYVDINSMYPFLMANRNYPIRLIDSSKTVCLEDLQWLLSHYVCVARVRINTSRRYFPLRINHRLCFPVGRFTTVLTTPELESALEHGEIEHVFEVAYYEHAQIFEKYVFELYNLRQLYREHGNETYSYMVKIMLNSLYGKFGQNGMKWEETKEEMDAFNGIMYEQETPDSQIRKLRYRGGVVQEFKREGESRDSFPAIAGHVTAYGREYLYSLFDRAGLENVYYCDTDSLITNDLGYERLHALVHPSELGKLKLEAIAPSATIWGPKDYRFDQIERHKGINRRAVKLSDNQWEQDQFRSWDYQLSNGNDGYIPIQRITKTLHRNYTKGIPTDSGWVNPFVLAE